MSDINERIRSIQKNILETDIRGCITGSSMIPNEDFSLWEQVPDIDVFVYSRQMLLYAVDILMLKHGYEAATTGEAWKINRTRSHQATGKKWPLETIKVKQPGDDIIINITWKKGLENLDAVISSFDMTHIMIGTDIMTGLTKDARTGAGYGKFGRDGKQLFPDDDHTVYPNPIRIAKQIDEADMFTVEQWVRQWDRVVKYSDRGFDTTPMAEYYIGLIDKVLEIGCMFQSIASKKVYEQFVETYEPKKQVMIDWLKEKKGE